MRSGVIYIIPQSCLPFLSWRRSGIPSRNETFVGLKSVRKINWARITALLSPLPNVMWTARLLTLVNSGYWHNRKSIAAMQLGR